MSKPNPKMYHGIFNSRYQKSQFSRIPRKVDPGPIELTKPDHKIFKDVVRENDDYIMRENGQILRKRPKRK